MKTFRLLFSDAMASAIVEGRKTVTRRPVDFRKLPHGVIEEREGFGPWPFWEDEAGDWHPETRQTAPGDLLIGRECWGWASWYDGANREGVEYRADGARVAMERGDDPSIRAGWRPSIHMPDWAARIRRRVVSVTVERVQDITEEDARREGVEMDDDGEWIGGHHKSGGVIICESARDAFWALWNGIYSAKGLGWRTNPFVWRIEFERENVQKGGVK